MSNRKNNLARLLESLLNEAQPPVRPQSMADFAPIEKKDISLDQVVDRYLIQYEKESIPVSEVLESANVDKLTNYLFEQDVPLEDDEEDDAGLDLGGDLGGDSGGGGGGDPGGGLDLGGDEPAGGAEADGEQKPVVQTPQINLQDFARSVARLIGNFHSLVDVNSILINRAEAYVKSNYDERTANELMEILDSNYDLRPVDKTDNWGVDSDNSSQPRAGVTGPVGG